VVPPPPVVVLGDVGLLLPPQPVMVMVTPARMANTDSAVNSRLEMAFPGFVLRNTAAPHMWTDGKCSSNPQQGCRT